MKVTKGGKNTGLPAASARVAVMLATLLLLSCLCAGCGKQAEKRAPQAIIEEMVVDYGS